LDASATISFDPFEPSWRNCPLEAFQHLREEAPVYQAPSGQWVLSRYSDVVRDTGRCRPRPEPPPRRSRRFLKRLFTGYRSRVTIWLLSEPSSRLTERNTCGSVS
jgi:hypothetical protein